MKNQSARTLSSNSIVKNQLFNVPYVEHDLGWRRLAFQLLHLDVLIVANGIVNAAQRDSIVKASLVDGRCE